MASKYLIRVRHRSRPFCFSHAAFPCLTAARNTKTKHHGGRELNALLQRLAIDLEDAKSAGESNGKRAEASALEVGLREEEGRRAKEALAATESKLAAEQR